MTTHASEAETVRCSERTSGQIAREPDLGRVITLRNGAAVRLRPIRPDDAPGLIELCDRLSPRTLYLRFFTVRRLRPDEAALLTSVDGHDRMAIVAESAIGQRRELVGVAQYALDRYDPLPDVGLVVEDAWQGLGLGSILFTEMMRAGEEQGFSTFRAEVLAENARMRRLLSRYADVLERSLDRGVITVVFRRPEDAQGSARSAPCWTSESPH